MLNTMPSHNPYAAYRQTAAETATPERLLLMLFDGAIKFVRQAELAIQNKDLTAANGYLLKVQDIFTELIVTLDMEQGEVAKNLYRLYDFYRSETITANIKKDANRLQPVLEFLLAFREVWAEAAKQARLEQAHA